MTNHDIVSVLKTSGIQDRVDHREVILPQLAAAGIERRVVFDKAGWAVMWGPVDAAALPDFLERGSQTTRDMRRVQFRWPRRFEMAVAWAFPMSLLALLGIPFLGLSTIALVGLIWGTSLVIFSSFPLYEARLHPRTKTLGFVLFDFGRHGTFVLLWSVLVGAAVALAFSAGAFSWGLVARWTFASFVIVLILSLDLTGSTPVYKSGLHDDRLLRIRLDAERCKGAGFCEQVCPTDVFAVDRKLHVATLPHADRCVQCGACLVQCPFDALYFETPTGEMVSPETVRKFKLNLLGKRLSPREVPRS